MRFLTRFFSLLFGSKKRLGEVPPPATYDDLLKKLDEFKSVAGPAVVVALKSIDLTRKEMTKAVELIRSLPERSKQIIAAESKMIEIQGRMNDLGYNRMKAIDLKKLNELNQWADKSDFDKEQRKRRLTEESLIIAKLDVEIWLVKDAGDEINNYTLNRRTPWPGRDV